MYRQIFDSELHVDVPHALRFSVCQLVYLNEHRVSEVNQPPV